jgi:hypothetical protein
MEGDENDETLLSSESSCDIQPAIREQFNQLAESLDHTNKNLHSFEFMLGQYKRLAKISPFQVTTADGNLPQQSQHNTDDKVLGEELKRIAHSLELLKRSSEKAPAADRKNEEILTEIQFLRSQLSENPGHQPSPNEETVGYLQGDERCASLLAANNRLTQELSNERERVKTLDRKLNTEQNAAQVVGRDIKKYVAHVKKLESDITEHLREEAVLKATLLQGMPNDSTFDSETTSQSVFCQTCLEDEPQNELQTVAVRVTQLARTIECQSAAQAKAYGSTADTSRLLRKNRSELKHELANALAERDSLHSMNQNLHHDLDIITNELTSYKAKHRRLKSKCHTLLSQYTARKVDYDVYSRKLLVARRALSELQRLCKVKDENQTALLDYFGNQVEICGRLLAAYADIDHVGPSLALTNYTSLADWFCGVHTLSLWTQKQLVAFGKNLWTTTNVHHQPLSKRFLKSKHPDLDSTLSDVSHSLAKDFSVASITESDVLPHKLKRILQSQSEVEKQTQESVGKLQNILDEDDPYT